MHGNPRSTTDADLAIDLSRTRRPGPQRPYDTNALKSFAARYPRQFIVGPKIYWILNNGSPNQLPIQVDFVDAHLFWAPFDSQSMVDFSPNFRAHPLSLLTLLVSKMRSAIERSHPNPRERLEKQVNDVQDFRFALTTCVRARTPLLQIHFQQLGHDEATCLVTIGTFWNLVKYLVDTQSILSQPIVESKQQWRDLMRMSGVTTRYIDGA